MGVKFPGKKCYVTLEWPLWCLDFTKLSVIHFDIKFNILTNHVTYVSKIIFNMHSGAGMGFEVSYDKHTQIPKKCGCSAVRLKGNICLTGRLSYSFTQSKINKLVE